MSTKLTHLFDIGLRERLLFQLIANWSCQLQKWIGLLGIAFVNTFRIQYENFPENGMYMYFALYEGRIINQTHSDSLFKVYRFLLNMMDIFQRKQS